jgi:primosomal protein N' (replication factor Y)
VPACRWCGRPAGGWSCAACGNLELRAAVVGARRTAEELGRAFPGVPLLRSGGDEVLATFPASPGLVVCTPGAEPVADGGYSAALLLDGWALLDRADLRAGEEALRRWLTAATLVRPATEGGTVVLLAPAGLPPVEALLRWDPAWHAGRELADRAELGFPPVLALATLTGPRSAVAALLQHARLPASATVLGPVPLPADPRAEPGEEPPVRTVVRVPPAERGALAGALHDAAAVRSARKEPGAVRVQVDPLEVI